MENEHQELRDKVWQALGEAALCWHEDGGLDRDALNKIATDLYDYVIKLIIQTVSNCDEIARQEWYD